MSVYSSRGTGTKEQKLQSVTSNTVLLLSTAVVSPRDFCKYQTVKHRSSCGHSLDRFI